MIPDPIEELRRAADGNTYFTGWHETINNAIAAYDAKCAEVDRLNDVIKTSKVLEAFKSLEKCATDLDTERAKSEWKLIDTAPKDGTRILVCSGDGTLVEVARWAWERWMSAPRDYNRRPTWWMPIPPLTPPAIEQKGSK